MIESVPVGAMVVTVALRIGAALGRVVDRALEVRERAALLGQLARGRLRLGVDEAHDLLAERDAPRRSRSAMPILMSMSAQPMTPRPILRLPRASSPILRQRVVVDVDDVVEEAHAAVHDVGQAVPVDVGPALARSRRTATG